MTIAEILLQDYDIEISNTRRTLERVPEGKNDWKCHDKSMPLGKLAMHCASITRLRLLHHARRRHGHGQLQTPPRPSSLYNPRSCLTHSRRERHQACRDAIAAASDAHLSAPWRFSFGEQIISNNPRSLTFRQMCFNHLIHHTAQLGVYLRLNDIPVPALYGPSADEQIKM